ncbi:hypothetical protein EIP91_004578 [Steccherinum ochraceum]|uniref:Molybdopterin cofactor biosynthesis C (MoaC) domain-containing protein n=1 Tax=Steccherinum ochraceum TaxID=92696 RepID=A0A4R0R8J1_9APHY|nr:hypothetical protein EIP91_004578 [Steccherinum ochraceum]
MSSTTSSGPTLPASACRAAADSQTQTRLTHIDETGRPAMVDVSQKTPTKRTATASGRIYIPKVAFDLIAPSTGPPSSGDSKNKFESVSHSNDTAQATASEFAELERAKAKARAKGDVLVVAQLAAIMGCKRTSDLIPLCHPLALSHIAVRLHPEHHPNSPASRSESASTSTSEATREPRPSHYSVMCRATVSCEGQTGVEMEALTAVSVGLLTVWDMLKAVAGKEMVIGEIVVESKEGGKSGDFVRTHVRC